MPTNDSRPYTCAGRTAAGVACRRAVSGPGDFCISHLSQADERKGSDALLPSVTAYLYSVARTNAFRGDRQGIAILVAGILAWVAYQLVRPTVATPGAIATDFLSTVAQVYGALLGFAIAIVVLELQWTRESRAGYYQAYKGAASNLATAANDLVRPDPDLFERLVRILAIATRTEPHQVVDVVRGDDYRKALEDAAQTVFDRLKTSAPGRQTFELLRVVTALEELEAAMNNIGMLWIESILGGIPVRALCRVAAVLLVALIAQPLYGAISANSVPSGLGFAGLVALVTAVALNLLELVMWLVVRHRDVIAEWVD